MNQTELNVIIPAYNEEDRIYHTLEYTVKQLSSFTSSFHIYCVNDGSEDHTGDEIQRFASQSSCVTRIDNDGNQGKGYALRHGVISCGPSEYIAFLDADLDIDPIQLKKYLEIMKGTGCDVVIGSKMHKDSEVDYPTRRRILSYGYYFIVRILFHLHVHDTQTGIKLFRYECIKKVMPKILVKRFAYDIEVLALCHHYHYKITEAPVKIVFQRQNKWGKIRFNDVYRTANDTLAVFYRLNILHYYDRSDIS